MKVLENKKVIPHSDAANNSKYHVAGVLRDDVVHCKKGVKVAEKWRWKPTNVWLVKHKVCRQKQPLL